MYLLLISLLFVTFIIILSLTLFVSEDYCVFCFVFCFFPWYWFAFSLAAFRENAPIRFCSLKWLVGRGAALPPPANTSGTRREKTNKQNKQLVWTSNLSSSLMLQAHCFLSRVLLPPPLLCFLYRVVSDSALFRLW